MFNGNKQSLFWIGLIILAFASLILFAILWQYAYAFTDRYLDISWMFKQSFPIMVGALVFILIGLYMMKSGVKKQNKACCTSLDNLCGIKPSIERIQGVIDSLIDEDEDSKLRHTKSQK